MQQNGRMAEWQNGRMGGMGSPLGSCKRQGSIGVEGGAPSNSSQGSVKGLESRIDLLFAEPLMAPT